MKVGDLVKHWRHGYKSPGIVIKRHPDHPGRKNKVFDILWQDGTMGHNVWNYDLEVINESR